MERLLGIEEARGRLGDVVHEVATGGDPVILTKRGRALAVLVSRDEYARLKGTATAASRAELDDRLAEVRKKIEEAGLGPEVVDEAIAAARRLA